ncbi:RNA-guided endonuclease InsQ/TnpB family protein [Tsuneonella sp. HG222]
MAERLIRTYRFRLKPTRAQHAGLRAALEHSRQLYNAALEERIDCYRKTGKGRTFFDQCRGLTELRKTDSFYSVSMERAPLQALDQAYRAFYARGGFPRFKGQDWFKSIAWVDRCGWKFDGRFWAKGLGTIRVHQHRAIPSPAMIARVKREGRHWFLFLVCEIDAPPANDNGEAVGLDLGLSCFAAMSDGTLIPNGRWARKAHSDLRRRQRALARCKRRSMRRKKAREQVAKAHARAKRARRTHQFQIAASLVRKFGLIAVEHLNVKGLARSRLARDVNDAAWGSFLGILSDKAASAGCRVVKVDPRGTSQTCPSCGTVKSKDLSERVHSCPCGLSIDRDVAAAQVILHRAVHGPAEGNVGGCAVRSPRKAA